MLIKGLPDINKLRKFVIPGKLDKKQFRDLQKGKEVDVNDQSGKALVEGGYAALVEKPKKVVKDG